MLGINTLSRLAKSQLTYMSKRPSRTGYSFSARIGQFFTTSNASNNHTTSRFRQRNESFRGFNFYSTNNGTGSRFRWNKQNQARFEGRGFSSKKEGENSNGEQGSLFERVKKAWKNTPLDWTPIPIGLSLGFLGFYQLWKKSNEVGIEEEKKTKGPWQVQAYTALPLKSISRLFGSFNELTLPTWLRVPGLSLYAYVFGCDLTEMLDPDLKNYPNLAAFFYRQIRPETRPIADSTLTSPADGRVLHFGVVQGSEIEQIKGVTYDLTDLLGRTKSEDLDHTTPSAYPNQTVDHEHFATVNGIDYSLQNLFSGQGGVSQPPPENESTSNQPPVEVEDYTKLGEGRSLFFCVVYLAPGDYHRFHSPTNWVVQKRRYFAGELYSVSPFVLNYLKNLFVLNERVALIGKWQHGFFSMLPVGATNVGSIKIHFDEDLKTNQKNITHRGTYTQVSYAKVSPFLKGYPVTAGQEMGGFMLGSTIVLVFEAPSNFQFNVQPGQKVKVGESLGDIKRMKQNEE